MNILAHVHLRNIVRSTGHGRVARLIVEQLGEIYGPSLQILADVGDYGKFVPAAPGPWNQFRYRFFELETSKQHFRWIVRNAPKAEDYWPDAELLYSTFQTYVPTRRIPLVVEYHDAARFERSAHRRDLHNLRARLNAWTLSQVLLIRHAHVLTISQFSMDRLLYFFPALAGRIHYVHHGVPPRFFQPPSQQGEEFIQRVRLMNRQYLLVPGGLHYRKNADLILKLWPIIHERYPDLQLVIAGHNELAYLPRAKSLGGALTLLDYVDDESLCSLYHHALLVWFPTRYEGFGLPVLEAMACGAPVISSSSSSIPEIAGGAAVLVPYDDYDQQVQAICMLLDNPARRECLIAAGLKRAAQFTWKDAGRRIAEYFESLVGR